MLLSNMGALADLGVACYPLTVDVHAEMGMRLNRTSIQTYARRDELRQKEATADPAGDKADDDNETPAAEDPAGDKAEESAGPAGYAVDNDGKLRGIDEPDRYSSSPEREVRAVCKQESWVEPVMADVILQTPVGSVKACVRHDTSVRFWRFDAPEHNCTSPCAGYAFRGAPHTVPPP